MKERLSDIKVHHCRQDFPLQYKVMKFIKYKA
jgi:hypothetical protein